MRFWSNLCVGLIVDYTLRVIGLCGCFQGFFGADWSLIGIVGERNLPAIKPPCRHAVSHRLLKATLNHTSPFQNGGDLDHLSTVPPKQIHRIGSHMFSAWLLITADNSGFLFMSCLDDEFMCLFSLLSVTFCLSVQFLYSKKKNFIHVIPYVCAEELLTPAWLDVYSRNPWNWLKLDLCKLKRRSSFTPHEIWDRTQDMPRLSASPCRHRFSSSLSVLGGLWSVCVCWGHGGVGSPGGVYAVHDVGPLPPLCVSPRGGWVLPEGADPQLCSRLYNWQGWADHRPAAERDGCHHQAVQIQRLLPR